MGGRHGEKKERLKKKCEKGGREGRREKGGREEINVEEKKQSEIHNNSYLHMKPIFGKKEERERKSGET